MFPSFFSKAGLDCVALRVDFVAHFIGCVTFANGFFAHKTIMSDYSLPNGHFLEYNKVSNHSLLKKR